MLPLQEQTQLSPLALSAEHVCQGYAEHGQTLTLFDSLHLSLKAGESLAIVGASGSGKSTLLNTLAGLAAPKAGVVRWFGQDIYALSEEHRAQQRGLLTAFIFQSFMLLPNLSAVENIALPLRLRGNPQATELAHAALAKVGLEKRGKHRPAQLSGGEQQRVAVARAFMTQPALLFADEPTGSLDRHHALHITELLFLLTQHTGEHPTSLVLVTHDHKLAELCQHCLNLDV